MKWIEDAQFETLDLNHFMEVTYCVNNFIRFSPHTYGIINCFHGNITNAVQGYKAFSIVPIQRSNM